MPTVVTNEFKLQEGGQNVSVSGDTWIASLMNEHVNSANSDVLKDYTNWFTEVSAYEASGTGYTSGVELSSVGWFTAPTDSVNIQRLSAADIYWSNVSIVAYGVAIWRQSDGLVMGFIDFGQQIASNSNFTVNWNSNGILNKI